MFYSPPKCENILFSVCIFWIMEWQSIPSKKQTTKNKKIKNFETDFIQCLDFCPRYVCKLAHISLNNASFAYLNLTF